VVFVLQATADAASSAKVGNLKMPFSKSLATVTLVNKSGEPRCMMWVDFNGRLVNYTSLRFSTNVCHPGVTDGTRELC
jgi:hypothetical protein